LKWLVTRPRVVRAREVNRRIEALGGVQIRQVGSHRRYAVRWARMEGRDYMLYTTVPQHNDDIPVGTLRAIERDLAAVFGPGWLR
jgi:predicted RNA binding protein YcfA (HicA-like mRNA interferase family)